GNTVKVIQVDTHMQEGTGYFTSDQNVENAYNVPVISLTGLTRDTYTVELRHIGQSVDGSVKYNPVSLDGFRVHGTLDPETAAYVSDKEDNPTFIELRNKVLAGLNVNTDAGIYAEDIAADTWAQVYASAESSEGAVVVSYQTPNEEGTLVDATVDVQDLLDNGPKNELYLRPGDAVVFKVTTNRVTQIGLKALNASVNYSVNNGTTTTTADLNTSTDMFYKLADQKDTATEVTYTITNNSGGILSITELKICDNPNVTFGELTEEDIAQALVSLGFESKEEPEVVYADATLNISLSDTAGVELAATTLTSNGIVGETAAFTAAAIEEAVTSILPEGYELAEASYTDQEVAYGEEATVSFTAEEVVEETPEEENTESESVVETIISTITNAIKNIFNKFFGWW
ncbi:MAG: hypothetical protein J6J03_04000, partial [Tyzzerella sp.]|nr:hypothetical protein [Tyzzerella sp.]